MDEFYFNWLIIVLLILLGLNIFIPFVDFDYNVNLKSCSVHFQMGNSFYYLHNGNKMLKINGIAFLNLYIYVTINPT